MIPMTDPVVCRELLSHPTPRRWAGALSLLVLVSSLGCSRKATHRAESTQGTGAVGAPSAAPTPTVASPERPAASQGALSSEPERARTLAAPLDKRGHYGAEFTGAAKQQLIRVLAQPQQYKDKPMTLSGVVQRVCQRKGCWMELASSKDEKAARCRIRFKDYSFFVPTNSEGAKAQVEGVLMVNKVAPGRVKHLEEEGAVFDAKNPDGSAFETQLIASAVELER
jgi:hypothetical protein